MIARHIFREVAAPWAINWRSKQVFGLKRCYVPSGQGMIDLVTGDVLTRNGTSDAGRVTQFGASAAYFDGDADSYSAGATEFINTGRPFTIVWQAVLDGFIDGYPCVTMLAANGQCELLSYSNDGSYNDIFVGSNSTWVKLKFALASVTPVVGNPHWGIFTYNGLGAGTATNFRMWVNGVELTQSTNPNINALANENRVGGTNLTGDDFNGQIRQVRVYDGLEWDAQQIAEFFDPRLREDLFLRSRAQRRMIAESGVRGTLGMFDPELRLASWF